MPGQSNLRCLTMRLRFCSIAGVSGSSPVLGQDYQAIGAIEHKELLAEN